MRKKERSGKVLVLLGGCGLLAILFFAGFAFASEVGQHAAAVESAQLSDLLYRTINFVLLLVILYFALRKTPIKEFFKGRREEIRKKLDDLRKGKEDTERQYRELEKKLEEFEAKKGEILEQFKAEGLAEKEKIVADARERAKQILAQAEQTIQREFQSAKSRLQAELVDVAAQKAQEIISSQINEDDQDHIIHEFIERVEKLN